MNVGQLVRELADMDPTLTVLVFNSDSCYHEELEEISWESPCNAIVLEKNNPPSPVECPTTESSITQASKLFLDF